MDKVNLVDNEGDIHEIEAIRLDNICDAYSGVKVIKPIKLNHGRILPK